MLEVDLAELLFELELDALFLEPLELADLAGIALSFRRAKPLAGRDGS